MNKLFKYIKKIFVLFGNKITWIFNNNSNRLKINYIDWLLKDNYTESCLYTSIVSESLDIKNKEETPKIVAFYLPQYYENEVNNENFGKGFTEWYNVTKAIPQFQGHYQPHIPIDVGFYNLSHDDIMYRQIELAKLYGIHAFCFYYYWFSGEKLLEKPLENFLNNKELDFPFCLMWANEDWTNEWSSETKRKTIMKQSLNYNDDVLFINDIMKYFLDDRYIKIHNKPVLIIYKSQKFEFNKFKTFLLSINKIAKQYGFDGIHLMTTNASYGEIDINKLNFESMIEFSPGLLPISNELYDLKGKFVNPYFNGKIIDIKKGLEKKLHLVESSKNKVHKCIFPGWDNSARKAYCKNGATILQMSPDDFEIWLEDVYTWTIKNHKKEEQFIFINAWNEWAEGAHLEPDKKYGYAYLQKIRNVLTNNNKR